MLVGSKFLQQEKNNAREDHFDMSGFLLSAPGFAMVMYALTQGAARGWGSLEIAVPGFVGVGMLMGFVYHALKIQKPILNLRLLQDTKYRTFGLISLCIAAGLLGMLYVFPMMVQDVFGASALQAGLITFPEALGLMASSPLVARFYSRLGSRGTLMIALICAFFLFIMLSMVQSDTNLWIIRVLMFCAGFCLGTAVGTVQASAFSTISPTSMNQASTLFQVQNRLGAAFGIALLSSVIAAVGKMVDVTPAIAYKSALLCSTLFLLAAFVLSRRTSKEKLQEAEAVGES